MPQKQNNIVIGGKGYVQGTMILMLRVLYLFSQFFVSVQVTFGNYCSSFDIREV